MSMTFKQAWWTKIMATEQEEETKIIKERDDWKKTDISLRKSSTKN